MYLDCAGKGALDGEDATAGPFMKLVMPLGAFKEVLQRRNIRHFSVAIPALDMCVRLRRDFQICRQR